MNIMYLIISTILIIAGLVGIFVPVLPGTWLVFGAIIFYAWGTGFQVFGIGYMILFTLLALAAWGIDYAASFLTAKKYGASKQGIIASIVLGLIGLVVFSVPGLIIGQLAGIILGELYFGKEMKNAVKSGVAVFIGYLLGNVVKVFICSIMVIIFYYRALTF